MNGQQLKGTLEVLLLSVLERGPCHGYAVITDLRDRSEGRFDLAEGTVYPALHRLEHEGLVCSHWSIGDGRRRRVYELTGAGVTALAEGRREWHRFSGGVSAVLGPAVVGPTLAWRPA